MRPVHGGRGGAYGLGCDLWRVARVLRSTDPPRHFPEPLTQNPLSPPGSPVSVGASRGGPVQGVDRPPTPSPVLPLLPHHTSRSPRGRIRPPRVVVGPPGPRASEMTVFWGGGPVDPVEPVTPDGFPGTTAASNANPARVPVRPAASRVRRLNSENSGNAKNPGSRAGASRPNATPGSRRLHPPWPGGRAAPRKGLFTGAGVHEYASVRARGFAGPRGRMSSQKTGGTGSRHPCRSGAGCVVSVLGKNANSVGTVSSSHARHHRAMAGPGLWTTAAVPSLRVRCPHRCRAAVCAGASVVRGGWSVWFRVSVGLRERLGRKGCGLVRRPGARAVEDCPGGSVAGSQPLDRSRSGRRRRRRCFPGVSRMAPWVRCMGYGAAASIGATGQGIAVLNRGKAKVLCSGWCPVLVSRRWSAFCAPLWAARIPLGGKAGQKAW